MLKKELLARQKYLNSLITKAKKTISTAPEGTLRIISHGSRIYFSFNGHYLPKKDYDFACKLANRNYCEKLMKLASKEISILEKLLDYYNTDKVSGLYSTVYEKMNENRKKLINPLEISDNAFISKWQNAPFEGKQLGTTYYSTARNENVRSKSEVIIANYLNSLKVPYKYEYPHILGNKTIYPDFTILNIKTRKEIIFEHFGMMDDESYRNNAFNKIELYINNGYMPGINFIYTFESQSHPLNITTFENLLKNALN